VWFDSAYFITSGTISQAVFWLNFWHYCPEEGNGKFMAKMSKTLEPGPPVE
jgi:hypothetical protein